MTLLFYLFKSKRSYKKFAAILVDNNKIMFEIHFGDLRYLHFTDGHLDKKRKEKYLARAMEIKDQLGRLTRDNILSPNWWSINLLWNEKTLEDSIKNVEKKFDVKIINKTNEYYDKKDFNNILK